MNKRKQYKQQSIIRLAVVIVIIVLVNMLDTTFFKRIDLTNEKVYTLTDSTKSLLKHLKGDVFVRVYLHGKFPAGFKRLEKSTQEMLDEFRVYAGDKLQYQFIDPLTDKSPEERQQVIKQLEEEGLQPTNLEVGGEDYSRSTIFPGAVLTYNDKETAVQLLENQVGDNSQNPLNNSIALLEHKFAFGIKQLTEEQRPKIGITYTHGELSGYNLYDLRNSLKPLYKVDSLDISRVLFLKRNYDVIIIPRPTQAFTEQEKFLLDQFIMDGGKVIWLVGTSNADEDSLRYVPFIAQVRDINLDDQLYKYGIRIGQDLLLDKQFNSWPYFPSIVPDGNNPIVRNLGEIAFRFTNSIDTIKDIQETKEVKKTVLLHSSQYTRLVPLPWNVDYSIFGQMDNSFYNKSNITVAILLEGKFQSLYKNRLAGTIKTAFDSLKIPLLYESKPNKMIVISDGSLVKNEVSTKIYPMGLFYYHQEKGGVALFDNKDFILNCVEYLTDNSGLIESRNKQIELRLLNHTRIADERLKWEMINMIVPIVIIILFGVVFNFIRTRRYAT